MKTIKVCMLLDNPFHPIDRRVYQEAKTLTQNGYEVTIVCKKDPQKELPEYEIIDGIKIQRCFRFQLGTSVLVDKYLEAHFDLLQGLTESFDIYHCHDPETWPIGYIIAKNNKAKFICDAHEYFPDYLQRENYLDDLKFESSRLLGLTRGQYIKYADGTISYGEIVANQIQKDYQLSIKPTVIHNTRFFKEKVNNKKDLFRQQFKISGNQKILLHHGNTDRSRGIENIIDVLTMVKSDFIFFLAGKCGNDYLQEIEERILKNGMTSKFHYIGFLNPNELLQYVASADINLYYPNVHCKNILYSVPNKFFEYIFAATPFVINNLEGMATLNQCYEIGYIADNYKDMAEKIDKLLSDPADYAQKVTNMRRAQQELCWENQESKLVELYQRVLKDEH